MFSIGGPHVSPQGLDRTKTIYSSGDWWGGAIGPVNFVTCFSPGAFLFCKHCVHPAGLPVEICDRLFHQGGCFMGGGAGW